MQFTSLEPFSHLFNESIKEDIGKMDKQLLDYIASELLYFKDNAKFYDADITVESEYEPSTRKRSKNIDIIYKLLFKSPVSSVCVNSIYHIMGSKLLRYDDDDYCDNVIEHVNEVLGYDYDDDYIERLVLIANALLNKNIFASIA